MKKVLIVGDSILDVYRDCSFKKECPDAPGVPAGIQNSIELRAGGAANVAANLLSLSLDVSIDLAGMVDCRLLHPLGLRVPLERLSISHIDRNVADHQGIVKERIIVDGKMLVRVDNRSSVDNSLAESVCRYVQQRLLEEQYDLIILSDYGAGTVNGKCLDLLLEHRDILLIDTKEPDLSRFGSIGQKALLIKLNEQEWKAALGRHHSPEQFFDFMVVTRGSDGAMLYSHRLSESQGASITRTFSIPGHDVPQVDVCGCGDTFLAGLASSMLSGRDIFDSLRFANCAAATVVSRPRTCIADLTATLELFGRKQ